MQLLVFTQLITVQHGQLLLICCHQEQTAWIKIYHALMMLLEARSSEELIRFGVISDRLVRQSLHVIHLMAEQHGRNQVTALARLMTAHIIARVLMYRLVPAA